MMSMVLLWPTFLALINGRDENPTNNGFSLSYFLPKPEMGVIFYSAYSIGATAIFVFALIDFIRKFYNSIVPLRLRLIPNFDFNFIKLIIYFQTHFTAQI